ncbi:NADP-dependent oxidoreductase domain-containing protein [Phellopilus nigrolimitatus]|nr:NADP-dependent oxidoreductase domain-containing protein [Phellopilus nigrolimitatus]
MPWDLVKLNDGNTMPSIAFGTWTLGNGQSVVDQVDQALDVGFEHIDTAQSYRNEAEAGQAFKESGLSRSDVFITTKWSGTDGLDIPTSITNSLKNLGVSYVDLYLIHSPRLANPDIPTVWAQMEKVRADGLAKSIGVSNFGVAEMETLLASAKVKPAVNQILFHPYVYAQQAAIVEAAKKDGIAIEAYSLLIPITRLPGGALDKPLAQIGARLSATPDQVLMAWAKAKGVVVVTTSSKESRLKGYLGAADLPLTDADIADIDSAGAVGRKRLAARTFIRRAIVLALAGAGVLGLCAYAGIDVL